MERKIGEIFLYNGEWYQCVEGDSCAKCDLRNKICTRDTNINPFKICAMSFRSDGKSVVFKKLEKIGEPMEFTKGLFFQKYRLHNSDPYYKGEKSLFFSTPMEFVYRN